MSNDNHVFHPEMEEDSSLPLAEEEKKEPVSGDLPPVVLPPPPVKKVSWAERVRNNLSGLPSVLWTIGILLLGACLGIFGTANFFASSGISLKPGKIDQPVAGKPVKELTKEQIDVWLGDISAKLREAKEKRETFLSRQNEKKRAYNILRSVKEEPAESPQCLQLLKETITLQGPLDLLNAEIDKLAKLDSQLRFALDDIELKGFVELNSDTAKLASGIKAALELDQFGKELGSEAPPVPDEAWANQNPDEFMKIIPQPQ